MTIRALINFLLDLDPDMEVAILDSNDQLRPICPETSECIEVQDAQSGEKEEVMVLIPCYGHEEKEQVTIENPNLN